MLYCRQAKNDMSIQWVYEINLPGVWYATRQEDNKKW